MSEPITPITRFGDPRPTEGSAPFQLTAFDSQYSSGGGTFLLQMIVVQGVAPVPEGMWPAFEMLQPTEPDVVPLRIVFVQQVSAPPLDPTMGNCQYGFILEKSGPNGWGPATQLKVTHPDLGDLIVSVQSLAP